MHMIYKREDDLVNEMMRTIVPNDSIAIWSLGSAGFVIKGAEENGAICIDPYLTNGIEHTNPGTEFVRAFPSPLRPEDLSWVDGVLVTHYHDDHLDPFTLEPLMKNGVSTVLSLPASHLSLIDFINLPTERIHPARDKKQFTINRFEITPIAGAHTEYETDELGNHFYLGYLIEIDNIRIFHAGDTVVTNELIERVRNFHPNVVFLPINGRDFGRTARGIMGNMTAREAGDFAREVNSDMLIPFHYDLFPNNTDNPAHFVDYLFRNGRAQKFHMLFPGERFIYMK